MITAQLANGTRLQFPDGTSQEVIQGVVRKQMSGVQETGLMEKLQQRGAAMANAAAMEQTGAEKAFQMAGQAAGSIGDVAGAALGGAAKLGYQALPQGAQEDLKSAGTAIAQSPVGQAVGQLAQAYGQNWERFAKDSPRAAANLEAAANIGGLLPISMGTKATATGVKGAANILGESAEAILKDEVVNFPAPKAISPLFEDIAENGIDDLGAFTQLRNTLGEEAARLQEEISGKFVDGQKVEPGLFDIAKDRGNNAFLEKISVQNLGDEIAGMAETEIGEAATLLKETGKRLKSLSNRPSVYDKVSLTSFRPEVTLNDIEGLRRGLSAVSNEGTARAGVAGQLTRKIDDFLADSLKQGSVKGDSATVEVWGNAISKRREFGNKFERPRELSALLQKGADQLSDEVLEQRFVGAGGAALNKNLSEVYKNTLKALPPEKRADASLRLKQSIVNRMVKNAAQSSDAEGGISAIRMANQIRNFRRDNRSMWNEFSDSEKATLNRLEGKLRKADSKTAMRAVTWALGKIARRELPRTLKPKTIIPTEKLIKMTKE